MNITSSLNARIRDLFECFKLSSFNELLPNHMEQYVTGKVLQNHSDRQRQAFITFYNTFYYNLQKWFNTQVKREGLRLPIEYSYDESEFADGTLNYGTLQVLITKFSNLM